MFKQQAVPDTESRSKSVDLLKVWVKAESTPQSESRLEQPCGSRAGSSFFGSFNELSLEELISWGGNGVYPYAD